MLGYTLAYYSDDTDLSWEIYLLRIQRLMGITTRVRPRVSGDEEGGGWAEDEAVSTFKRSAWHDCQLGEYFGCVELMVVLDSLWIEKVVVDGATVVSGGWDQRAVFWVKTPQNLFFSFVFRNWKGVSTSSVRRWSWTPTSTSSQLALPMSTMWGGKVDTWQNCQNRSSSAFMSSFEYTSTLLLFYSSLFSVKASWISWALSTNSWWASLFLNST